MSLENLAIQFGEFVGVGSISVIVEVFSLLLINVRRAILNGLDDVLAFEAKTQRCEWSSRTIAS